MKMKKRICALLASAIAIGSLAGCGGGGGSIQTENYQDSDEKLTITWLGFPLNAGAQEGSIPEKALEEKFNVDIKPLFYEYNNFNDKKTMLMAGGEVPDLIYEMDPAFMQQDVDQEFLAEIPYETVKEYAPEYYAYLNDYAPAAWIYSRYKDKNYGLPNVNHTHMVSQTVAYRKDWLDKLHLSVPETLDEYHDVLYQFANGDPDGNGKDDTYGMTVSMGHYQGYFSEVFGAYGCLPFDWQEAEDGSIVYGGTTEECKEVLKVLASWYAEGIIHPDFVLAEDLEAKWNSGVIGTKILNKYHDPSDPKTYINTLKANNPDAEVVLGFLPTGPEGKSGMRAWGRACHVVSFGQNEGYGVKVPRMLKMLEGMFTDFELGKKVRIGIEGETYEQAPADTTAANNFVMLAGYGGTSADETRLAGLSQDFGGPTFWSPVAVSYDDYMSTRSDAYKTYINEWTDEKYCLTDYFYKVDVVPSSPDYIIDLRNRQMAVMNEVIIGKAGIEAYDEFIAQWNNGGGKIMTDEANQLKNDLSGIYKEIGIQ